jgi:hypothetical protein
VARGSGINLLFLGANNLWWHTRLATINSSDPEPDRQIVYRSAVGDPSRGTLADLTLLWSQWPEHRDPAAILGESHAGINVHGGYQLLGAPTWMLAGTGLHPGTVDRPGSVLPMAVGNEADGYNALANDPSNLTVVAAGVLRGATGPVTASAGYYVAASGAGVFAAGSTDWACALQGDCFDQRVPDGTTAALRQITTNIVTAFALPRAGSTHPSEPGVTPPAAQLQVVLDPAAIGSYGVSDSDEESGKSAGRRHS